MKMALKKRLMQNKFQHNVHKGDNDNDEAIAKSYWKRRKTLSQSGFVISIEVVSSVINIDM